VKLWDSLSGNSIQTLKHPSAVNCLQVRDYNVVSAAKDVIYIWDMRMGRWHKLKSHTRPVLCMHYYEDNRLVRPPLHVCLTQLSAALVQRH
jgi:WD40 repeat protein